MTQTELRNILVKLLYDFLGGPKVLLSSQVMPEAEYPYLYYQSIQLHIPGPWNITQAAEGEGVTKRRCEHAQASYSFTACGMNRQGPMGAPISGDDEALDLADRAQGFFLYTGRQLLADRGGVVVSVETTQSRSAMGIDETDRRYGFDVLLHYERRDDRSVPAMEPPTVYLKEEYESDFVQQAADGNLRERDRELAQKKATLLQSEKRIAELGVLFKRIYEDMYRGNCLTSVS